MSKIYRNGATWYAPDWLIPSTGQMVPAHSLGTRDKKLAADAWALERARHMRPVAVSEGRMPAAMGQLPISFGRTVEEAIRAYFDFKTRWKPATRKGWEEVLPRILEMRFSVGEGEDQRFYRLGDMRIAQLAGNSGEEIVAGWTRAAIALGKGRTHTAVKRIENILKPTLRMADRKGWLGGARLPVWPEIRTDYQAAGRRKLFLTPAQFVAISAELAPYDAIRRRDGSVLGVYPRLWAEIIVETGMHDSDVSRFSEADFDQGRALWYRRNTKGDHHYAPEWLPTTPMLQAALERAALRFPGHPCGSSPNLWDRRPETRGDVASCGGCGRVAHRFVSDGGAPGKEWMKQRLKWAAIRAELPFEPQPIDFRHTCAVWKKDADWDFDKTAKWLGNSTGMVRFVYAQSNADQYRVLAARMAENAAEITRLRAAYGPRRGPRISRTHLLGGPAVVETVVKRKREVG